MSDTSNPISWDDDDDEFEVEAPQGNGSSVEAPPVFATDAPELYSEEAHAPVIFDHNADIISVEPVPAENGSEHMIVVQTDADGNEVSITVDLALPPLNEEEAREITDRIRSTTSVLYLLIKRAHAGKAWTALGYTSFESYVKEEFSYSRSYAYKLLNQANVIEAIEAVAPPGTSVYVGELTARGLKKSLPELLEEVEERTAGEDPEEATAIIEDIIRETKDRKDGDSDFEEEDFDDFNPGEYSNKSSAFDYIDDDDDSLDEFLGNDDDPSAVVNKLENLYTLLTGLQNFADLAAKDNLSDLLPLIPVDRRDEVTRLVEVNSEWMGKLKNDWETYLRDNAVSNDEVADNDEFSDSDEGYNDSDF